MHSSGLRTAVHLRQDPGAELREPRFACLAVSQPETPEHRVADAEAGAGPERKVAPDEAEDAIVLRETEWIALVRWAQLRRRDPEVLQAKLVQKLGQHFGDGVVVTKRQP